MVEMRVILAQMSVHILSLYAKQTQPYYSIQFLGF